MSERFNSVSVGILGGGVLASVFASAIIQSTSIEPNIQIRDYNLNIIAISSVVGSILGGLSMNRASSQKKQ